MTASAALSPVMHLYLDETGARHPDRAAAVSKHGCDWFAIGGLLINEEDIDHAKAELAAFLSGWPQIRSPLHLTDMRSEHKGFAWLGKLDVEERSRFWSEYRRFLARVKVAGTACVIDRPGYVARGYTWADISGTATTVSTVPRFLGFSSISTAKLRDIALVTGRLGYAADNWLFYVKGGGAWGQGKSFSFNNNANGTLFDTSSSSTDRSGWVVGVGAEWGFAPNWSAKIEYNYIDFGSTNVTLNSSNGTQSFVSSSETVNIVKAGVNYRFNWGGPVGATY